jgi:hypothetical protein
MIIETPKLTRNIIILQKNSLKLYEYDKKEQEKFNNENFPSINTTYNTNRISKTIDLNKSSKIKNINEWKKKLFLDNILSTDKKYFLKDYMKRKEIKLIKDKNKNIYQARKTFFSEEKIDNCRTSYFSKDVINYKNTSKKVPLMIKDIEANLILMKNNRNKMINEYLKRELEFDLYENNYYTDFNDKLGVKNVFMKTNIFPKVKKGIINKNINTNNFVFKDFKAFNSSYKIMTTKNLIIN